MTTYHSEKKFQAKIFPYDQHSLTSPYLKKSDLDNINTDIKASNDKHHYELKSTNEQITAMLAKLNYKYDKKIEKQLQPSSVQIIEI